MEVATAPRAGARRARGKRADGWSALTILAAALVAGPLLVLPASFVVAPDALSDFTGLLPDAVLATVYLLVGVGLGTLVLGTSLAALVAFCDFPGRRWLEWAVVLPLAMPGYVFTLFALGARDDLGLTWLPLRSAGGAVAVFTLTLYPYVYLLARNAFLSQGAELVEAARGLGLSPLRADRPGGGAHRPPGHPGRRRAGADGVAGRLRQREPAGRPDVHQRHLQGLQRRLRPRRRAAAGHAAGVGHADAAGASSAPRAGVPATPPRAAAASPRSGSAGRRPWPPWPRRWRWWRWWCWRRWSS